MIVYYLLLFATDFQRRFNRSYCIYKVFAKFDDYQCEVTVMFQVGDWLGPPAVA